MKISQRNVHRIIYILDAILILIAIVFYLYKSNSFDFGFLNSEVSAYLLVCKQSTPNGNCEQKVAVPKITFKVYTKQQDVVLINDNGIDKLSPCTIVNLRNWECTPSGSDISFIFTDGNFSMSVPNDSSPYSADISKISVVSEQEWSRYPVANDKGLIN